MATSPRVRDCASKRGLALFWIALFVLSLGLQYGGFAHAASVLAANPSADLDQCANDPPRHRSTDGCDTSATEWVNGNLGASKSVYLEGDSIPYRLTFDNLSLAVPHGHDRVGHHQERQARARLPDDLQPLRRRRRTPVSA